MEKTAYLYLSATTMAARQRRMVVIATVFAWLTLLLTCPNVLDGVRDFMPAEAQYLSHATADSAHGTAHDDACCTASQHTAALATAQKFNLTINIILTFVLPVLVTSLTVLVVVTSNRDFMRSSRSGWTRNSPLFWTLWPQAPPR